MRSLFRGYPVLAFPVAAAILFSFGLHDASGADPRPLIFLADRDYPPMAYLENGIAKGMDVDFGAALAQRMNRQVRIELMDWNRAQDLVRNGEADGLLGMTISEERRKLFDFAEPMFTREFGLLVRNGEMTIHGAKDLQSRNVGVTSGGFPRQFIEAQPGVNVVLIDNYQDGIRRLTDGAIDAIAADLWVAAYMMEKGGVRGVTTAGKPFATAPAALAVKKGNSALLEDIDRAIQAMKADGTIAGIRGKWRPQEILIMTRERVRGVIALAAGLVLLVLFGAMCAWILTLKRQVRIRREAEAALRESEERLRAVFEKTPNVAIQLYNAQGRVLLWNEASHSLYGWSAAEAVGKTLDQLIHTQEEARQFVALLGEIAATGKPQGPSEFHVRRRDGSDGYCLATVFSIPATGGGLSFVCMDVDLTDLKKADAALRESEARLRTLADASFEGIAVSQDGIIVDANDQMVRMLGYDSRADIKGRPVVELVAPESRALVRSRIESGRVEPYEHMALRKDGTIFPVEVCGRNISRTPHHVRVTAVRDMTARKQEERALRESEAQHAESLRREQHALETYTRQLIASQEAERRRIAGELHDSLGQNLLLVKNRAQMALAPGYAPPDMREQIEGILAVATEAIAEVRQIAHALHPYQLDHLGLTRAIEAMIESAAQSTDVIFERKLDSVDDVFSPELATNLYRVAQECLNNVLKHARAANVWIEVERDIHDVRLLVKDNGRGFALDQIRPGDLSGGLGLKNIAERVRIMGGTLKITTAPGAGAAVEVVIPIPGELIAEN